MKKLRNPAKCFLMLNVGVQAMKPTNHLQDWLSLDSNDPFSVQSNISEELKLT